MSENILVIQPYGPKMCSLICQNHQNCTSYVFNEVHLGCQLVFNTTFGKRSSGKRDSEDGPLNHCSGGHGSSQDDYSYEERPGCDEEYVDLLHEACEDGDMEEVEKLVCQGKVDVNCQDDKRKTAAMIAVKKGKEKILDFLVNQNANLSARDENEYTALHHACNSGVIDIVRKLVDDFKMDIEARTDEEETPLFRAVYSGFIQVVKFLIERGANVKTTNKYKSNIIIEACRVNEFDLMKYVLSLNSSVDIESRDLYGKTPLMYSKETANEQIEELLRNRGANV